MAPIQESKITAGTTWTQMGSCHCRVLVAGKMELAKKGPQELNRALTRRMVPYGPVT